MAFSSSSFRSSANFSTLMRTERAVLAVADQRLDGGDDCGIGGIAERAEQGVGLGVGHGREPKPNPSRRQGLTRTSL